jgi:hypothetical protein
LEDLEVLSIVLDASWKICYPRRNERKMVSRTAKEKVAYWARNLECPVDENANYENTYVC